jgi:hypothetical protein
MAIATYFALHVADFAAVRQLLVRAGMLAAIIAGSVAVYMGLAWLLRCEELFEFLLLVKRSDAAAVGEAGLQSNRL